MNFSVERKEFVKTISKFLGIAEKSTTQPILSAILVSTDGLSKVRLFGTNLEISLSDSAPADVSAEGKIAIDCRKIYEIIKELPDGKVNLALQENRSVLIKAGKSKFTLQTYAPEEFPTPPGLESELQFEIQSEAFLDMVKKTAFAVGEQDTRYVLNGLLTYFKKTEQAASIRMVGTDGHRLAISAGVVNCLSNGSCQEKKMVIPKKAVMEIKKLVSETDLETIHLSTGKTQVTVTIGETRFSARMLEGSYPEYAKIIPEKFSKNVTFRKEEIEQAIRRVSILSNKEVKGVKLSVDQEKASLSAASAESGTAEDEISLLYQGEKFETGFNSRYLLDAFGAVEHEEIVMNINEPISPAAFKNPKDPNSLWIVMPMRI